MSKLDVARIVDEAMLILDEEGEGALSMRALAARLGVTPMALYRHFTDRDDLLLALVERVSEEISFPEPAEGPVDRAVDLALCLHGVLVQYPWMSRLISSGRLASPAGLRFPDGLISCGRDAGLTDDGAFAFYRTMFAAILGQAAITHAQATASDGSLPNHVADTALPAVAALAPRWSDLDRSATPRRIFRGVAALLPAF